MHIKCGQRRHPIRRTAANIMNEQSWTAEKGRPSTLGTEITVNNLSR